MSVLQRELGLLRQTLTRRLRYFRQNIQQEWLRTIIQQKLEQLGGGLEYKLLRVAGKEDLSCGRLVNKSIEEKKCVYCRRKFDDLPKLRDHLKQHISDGCNPDHQFPDAGAFKKHLVITHKVNKTYYEEILDLCYG